MPITVRQLAAIMPTAARISGFEGLERWIPHLNAATAKYEIDVGGQSGNRLPFFYANIAEETGELFRGNPDSDHRENLNYTAEQLLQHWSGLFKSPDEARALAAAGPEAIANHIYSDAVRPGTRFDLGNTEPGDGWKYRGGGLIQTTGKGNWQAVFRQMGLPLDTDPQVLCDVPGCCETAGFFWYKSGCNRLADDGDFRGLVLRINGGQINLDVRQRYLARARAAFTSTPIPERGRDLPEPPQERRLLAPGATGLDVMMVQKALNEMDGAGLLPDGKYGDLTTAAVRLFQQKRGLDVDGVVGRQTYAALGLQ